MILFVSILVIGEAVLWLFLRHAKKTRRVSFFGFSPTNETDDPVKYRKVISSYQMQIAAFPIVALFVVWMMV